MRAKLSVKSKTHLFRGRDYSARPIRRERFGAAVSALGLFGATVPALTPFGAGLFPPLPGESRLQQTNLCSHQPVQQAVCHTWGR